ncbi:MAG TPA: Smr/MutS family protein [Gemmatimonadaceae bacterium]|jgi:hypothetical protein
MRSGKTSSPRQLWKAFDEATFGSKNTLNLRESLPTAADARFRTDTWLRERQVGQASEVLVITGRGNNSPGGISVVRETIARLLPQLRRRGVVSDWREHSPGAFVVRLAPIKALLEAPSRRRDRSTGPVIANPVSLSALETSTLALLRRLAQRSLEALGVRESEKFVEAEMISQFEKLSGGMGSGSDRERKLQAAITSALDLLDE